MNRGNFDDAIRYLTMAGADSTTRTGIPRCMLAQAYLKARRYAEAAGLLKVLIGDFNDWPETSDLWLIKSHYYLGLAYESMGDAVRASEQYRWFIETWKDADVTIPAVSDAVERLARLKS